MAKRTGRNWFEKMNSIEKLLICILLALGIPFIFQLDGAEEFTRVMIGWDVFSLTMIIMSWITFSITKPDEIRNQVKKQDPKRAVVFMLIVFATVASIFAVMLMVFFKRHGETSNWHTPVAISGMLLSWFLIHTVFALRYAHIFYGNDPDNPSNHAGGLKFPETKKPEYTDFAYFSFVLGMTFQVSDIQITSPTLRKYAMWHGMLSFAYSTIIIAVTINVTMS